MNEMSLTTTSKPNGEIQSTAASAREQAEIQSACVMAMKNPRDEERAYERTMIACRRHSFSEKALFSFPRGGKTIYGPSINLAREMARLWGNMRHGFDIIQNDDQQVTIRGWAWDLETNTKTTQEASFSKLIQRKINGKATWVQPDERDLRELINKHGAIAERNCIFQIIPSDFVEDAINECRRTQQQQVKRNPQDAKQKILSAFAEIGVKKQQIEQILKHSIDKITDEEIVRLRGIFTSMKEDGLAIDEFLESNGEEKEKAPEKAAQPANPEPEPPKEQIDEPVYNEYNNAIFDDPENELHALITENEDIFKRKFDDKKFKYPGTDKVYKMAIEMIKNSSGDFTSDEVAVVKNDVGYFAELLIAWASRTK